MKVIAINGSPKSKGNTWNVIHGGTPGEVTQDNEGMSVLKNLANNMAWMIKMKDYCKNTFPVPDPMLREWTNFIR